MRTWERVERILLLLKELLPSFHEKSVSKYKQVSSEMALLGYIVLDPDWLSSG